MSNELITPAETARLEELEARFEICKATFLEGGAILSEIMESKIYKDTYKSFEIYLKDRWDISPRRAYQLIEAANTVESVKNFTQNPPKTESQAKELSKAPKDQRPAAWEKAQEIAKEEGKPVAARHVEAAVLEVMPKEEPEPVVVDGVEESINQPRLKKSIPDDAHRLWMLAKTDLEKILKVDKSREIVLKEIIKYAQNRIDQNK